MREMKSAVAPKRDNKVYIAALGFLTLSIFSVIAHAATLDSALSKLYELDAKLAKFEKNEVVLLQQTDEVLKKMDNLKILMRRFGGKGAGGGGGGGGGH